MVWIRLLVWMVERKKSLEKKSEVDAEESRIAMPKPFPHLLLVCLMLLILPSIAVAQDAVSLKRFLQNYVGNPPADSDKGMRYLDAWVDLNGDGKKEVIVYLLGWCGSGGCSTLILEPKDSSYTVVTEMTVTQLPIRMLTTTSHGWHDLSVLVWGGGIQEGHEAG